MRMMRLFGIQVDVLVDVIVLELLEVLGELDEFVGAGRFVVRSCKFQISACSLASPWCQRNRNKLTDMVLVLLEDLWLSLLSSQPVAERSFDEDLIENGAVLELNGQSVGNGTLAWVVVVLGKLWVLNALDALSQALEQRRGSGLTAISVIGGDETVEDKHVGNHVLDAVVTVGEVVHGLELLVDDADAGLVCTVGDLLDVLGGLAHGCELLVDDGCGLDGGLRVELGWVGDLEEDVLHDI